MASGYIYVLSNPSMPGLLKIGYTCEDVQIRARALSSTTGVPGPFEIEYFYLSGDVEEVEKLVHRALRESRHTEVREFFTAPLDDVISLIEQHVRPPVTSFRRTPPANKAVSGTTCRRCGFGFERNDRARFCPRCGF